MALYGLIGLIWPYGGLMKPPGAQGPFQLKGQRFPFKALHDPCDLHDPFDSAS